MEKRPFIEINEAMGSKAKKQSQAKEVWHRLRKNRSAMVGLVINLNDHSDHEKWQEHQYLAHFLYLLVI